ncbi:MAG: pseudouridine synthase [Saprospiraceae bacterium]|nr:pseudouridine synthase [Saprospiraceae bacterium]
MQTKYYLLYKPFGVLSQFTPDHEGQITLSSLADFPRDVYPIGRLDRDSEGLLLMTNDNAFKNKVLSPGIGLAKTYLVQVEGRPTQIDLQPLQTGVTIRLDKRSVALKPADVKILKDVPDLPERVPPIRYRRDIPDQWIEITIREGKNRQVRRMLASVGFPVLRLVRSQIGQLKLNSMVPGEVIEMERQELRKAIGF